MGLHDIEIMIFNCPYIDSIECSVRLRCHPIPGYGSEHPEFLVLGINPARRGGVWCRYGFLEKLKSRYLTECINPQYPYGRLLKRLEKLVPQFRIPENVYLTDIVKCPTRKRSPPQSMVEKCVSTYLEKIVRLLNPKFIICLGKKPTIYVEDILRKNAASSRPFVIGVPHPSRVEIETIATAVAKKAKEPKAAPLGYGKNFFIFPHTIKKKELGNMVEEKLVNLGYRKTRRKKWTKENRVVHLVYSSEFGRNYIRIMWREEWKDDHAIVYDYSGAGGPVCIVPVSDLFTSDFVKEKRKKASYANSGYWWSQRFPADHKLAKLVLSFKDRWNIL